MEVGFRNSNTFPNKVRNDWKALKAQMIKSFAKPIEPTEVFNRMSRLSSKVYNVQELTQEFQELAALLPINPQYDHTVMTIYLDKLPENVSLLARTGETPVKFRHAYKKALEIYESFQKTENRFTPSTKDTDKTGRSRQKDHDRGKPTLAIANTAGALVYQLRCNI